MADFSVSSIKRLVTLDVRLQKILKEAIKIYDFSILEGYRDEKTQDKYYKEGKSKLKFPNSKHNTYPSKAVDIAPYPIDWKDTSRFIELKNIIFERAEKNEVKLRWGGDWDDDGEMNDQQFNDLVHFELV